MLWTSACVVCESPADGVCAVCRFELERPIVDVPDELDSLLAIFSYSGVGERLLKQVKFANRRQPLRPLVRATVSFLPDVDLIVPVPVRSARRRARGYSLPDLMASAVKREMRTPYRSVLQRVDEGDQQGRGRADRLNAIEHRASRVRDRVLLVDDVITTGATLASCARALRRAGATEVHAFVLASTPNFDNFLWPGLGSADRVNVTDDTTPEECPCR